MLLYGRDALFLEIDDLEAFLLPTDSLRDRIASLKLVNEGAISILDCGFRTV